MIVEMSGQVSGSAVVGLHCEVCPPRLHMLDAQFPVRWCLAGGAKRKVTRSLEVGGAGLCWSVE